MKRKKNTITYASLKKTNFDQYGKKGTDFSPDSKNSEEDYTLLEEVLLNGRESIRKLEHLNNSVNNEVLNEKINDIIKNSGKIFDFIEKDSTALLSVRNFYSYYLPTTLKLLNEYVELCQQNINGTNTQSMISKFEYIIDNVQKAFAKQLDILYSSRVMDLSSEIHTLEFIMKENGL